MVKKGPLTPKDQLKVLSLIWGDGESGYVFLPWIPGNMKSKEQRKKNWHEDRGFEWPNDRAAILLHLQDHQEDDLYFTPNTFLTTSRVSQSAGEETTLWADLDEVNPNDDIDRAMQPSIAWETSPGRYQGVWLMEGMYPGASDMGGVNHRLTSAIGADPSGWDTTQLLRVPGRPNYKPEYKDDNNDPATGQVVWIRRKIYPWSFFDDLPEVYTFDIGTDTVEESEVNGVDRHEVWARVRMRCTHAVRSFMSMRERDIDSDSHDRSEVLWQIERDLADAGCSIVEIISVVRATPWNKYAGRRNELTQLRTEAIKAKSVTETDKEDLPLEQAVYDGTRPTQPIWLSDVVANSIPRPNWLVRNIWARGACGFIAAEPKSYKSYFGLDMAVSIATGTPFLNDPQFSTNEANVLYLQEEDSLPLVMHRLQQIVDQKSPDRHWHGQLTSPVSLPPTPDKSTLGVDWEPPRGPVNVALHVRTGFVASDPAWQAWLAEFVEENNFVLTIIDTLGTTLGDLTITDEKLYPRVLNPLKEISNATGCAIAIIHHNRKNADPNQRRGQQMTGSGAFHAWSESALYLSKDEYVSGKNNTVKVERENKLAEDLKFRVKIPPMYVENGSAMEGNRQLWQPEVWPGWGDPEGDQEVIKDAKRKPAGSLITDRMLKAGLELDTPYQAEDIAQAICRPLPESKKQLQNAVQNHKLMLTEEGYIL